jgi:monovalent cation/hydrogen antiporter
VHEIESLIFLLAAAALLAQFARLLKVPYPILLVVGGLAMGFVPGLPDIEIPPEVIFVVFLPPLLNSAAFSSSPLELRAQLRPIVLLAVGLVLATMGAVAVIAHFLISLPWAAAFVLGAILAPTDPVAAEAIFGRLGVPERVGTVVGGESLVNDGTGLVAFRVAVAVVVSGAFSVWEAGLSFLLVGGGGLLVGVTLARIVLPLWARLRDPTILITFSVLIPYAVYILAEEVLHVSGILAVVTYGLYQGWRAPRLFPDASTRLQALAFWGVLVFLLEALLFVLLGQQLPSILGGIEEYSVWVVLLYASLVYAAVVVVRFAWFFTTPYFHPVFDRLLHGRYLRAPWQERVVMSWSGMRGAVSLAAALAVPRRRGSVPRTRPDRVPHLLGDPRYPGAAGAHPGSADSGAAPEGRQPSRQARGAPGPPRRRPRGPRQAGGARRRRAGLTGESGAHARVLRGEHTALHGGPPSRRHDRGVCEELRGLARLAARTARGGAGSHLVLARRGQDQP